MWLIEYMPWDWLSICHETSRVYVMRLIENMAYTRHPPHTRRLSLAIIASDYRLVCCPLKGLQLGPLHILNQSHDIYSRSLMAYTQQVSWHIYSTSLMPYMAYTQPVTWHIWYYDHGIYSTSLMAYTQSVSWHILNQSYSIFSMNLMAYTQPISWHIL